MGLVTSLKEQLSNTGIKVVKTISYEVKEAEDSTVVIVSGYLHLPRKALISIVYLILKGEDNSENKYIFKMNGEVTKRGRIGFSVRSNWFPNRDKPVPGEDVPRRVHGCELSYTDETFKINNETSDPRKGIDFIQNFLKWYGYWLAEKFTRKVSFCFSLKCLKELRGLENTSYLPEVVASFPEELFSQKPEISTKKCSYKSSDHSLPSFFSIMQSFSVFCAIIII